MKRAALVLAALAAVAPAAAAGPADWTGTWKGTCRLTPPHQGIAEFPMTLTIGATAKPDALRWMLVYETGTRDVRDYELLAVDAAAGTYVIDEKNGLLLDAAFSDGVLYAPFTIGKVLITATYRVDESGTMHADMPSFGAEPSRTSCLTGQPETCARSFALTGTQHCWMKRQEMRKLD